MVNVAHWGTYAPALLFSRRVGTELCKVAINHALCSFPGWACLLIHLGDINFLKLAVMLLIILIIIVVKVTVVTLPLLMFIIIQATVLNVHYHHHSHY